MEESEEKESVTGVCDEKKEEISLENLSQNLDDLWQEIDDLFHLKEGDFKQIAAKLSKLVHRVSVLLVTASNKSEYESISCEFCHKNNIFQKIYNWTGQHRECLRFMAHEQLQYFNTIIQEAGISLLTYKNVIIPMLLLLMSLKPTDKRKVPPDIETLYVSILYFISQQIVSDDFLDLLAEDLYTPENFKIPKFTFFELLILYTHHPGENGIVARKGILMCINIARTHSAFEKYISEESAASVIIAAGLSARYSSLPMTLEINSEDWYYITQNDLKNMSELQSFLQALDFCCDVTEASNPKVKSHLAKLIYDGFLMSVLAPALNQSQFDAQVAVMAYLDLFLRCITSPKVMEVFLRVLMTDAYDNKALITLLIYHINSESVQLSMVAIQLFKTLLELNCEDIIFHLIFRYLLPCNHILPNQKRTIKSMDYYCKSATMFLYLTPSCCIETNKHNNTIEQEEGSPKASRASTRSSSPHSRSSNGSPRLSRKMSATSTSSRTSNFSIQPELRPQETFDFMAYLQNAKDVISACKHDCKCWSAVYDGMDFVTENPRNSKVSALGSTSSYGSPINFERTFSDSSDCVLEDLSGLKFNPVYTTEVLGPFLNAIFDKLETMLESNLYVNLLLSSLVARLACYPQPLLRSFLLNANLVIRPGVRSLALVLKRVSDSAETFVTRLDDYKILITKARQNLMNRGEKRNTVTEEPTDANDNKKLDMQCTISLDHATGSTKFQRKENQQDKNDKQVSVDELISLTSSNTLTRSASVSVNTSLVKRGDNELKRTATISNPGSVGRLHPALPKFALRSPTKQSKNFPSKTEIAEMRKKNPTMIKNAVYCVVVMEEFMKELAAISIEQTLQ